MTPNPISLPPTDTSKRITDEAIEAAARAFAGAYWNEAWWKSYDTVDSRLAEAMRAALEAAAPFLVPEGWRETVRAIFDELHHGKVSIFTGTLSERRLARHLVKLIETRHHDYFCEAALPPPPADRGE